MSSSLTLLAKSVRKGRALTLVRHLLDTEEAAVLLFRNRSRWAEAFLRFFKLPQAEYPCFMRHLQVAALFHDIGKANNSFQTSMRSPTFAQQAFRHEHLSALVLTHPPVRVWLAQAADLDQDVVVAAVLSHHLKAGEHGKHEVMAGHTAARTQLLLDDAQIGETLDRVAELLEIPRLSLMWPGHYQETDSAWQSAWDEFWARAQQFADALRNDRRRLALNLAVKAGVIAADSIASAMFREDVPSPLWIEGVAHCPALESDAVKRDILEPRKQEIENHTKKPFTYQEFQSGAADIGARGLLMAGCGAGKTLAAWRWADSMARTRPIGRVIFLYPTRGTATEGFRDYVGHAPEGTAALVTGTARYELEGMRDNPPDALKGKAFVPSEADARLFALGLWSKQYFSATVDQFLSFVEHSYGGLCLLPALADAAVVLDEIHSYDRSMWNALITFLKNFDMPVLCMTATLPLQRRRELQDLGMRLYPDASEREALTRLEREETHPRYEVNGIQDEQEALRIVGASQGQRVLWVVNTVARCQRIAEALRKHYGIRPLVYHSRFTLEDRKHRHRDAVDAFRPSANGDHIAHAVAITTQVCEMSLDLDADVLVTEHAPVASLVQRFGRAHRHRREGRLPARVYTYAPEQILPYERREIEPVPAFLAGLMGRTCNQRDLAEGLELHSPLEPPAAASSRFTRGGFFATPGSLRDSEDGGVPAILSNNVDEYLQRQRSKQATDGLRLNVPRKFAQKDTGGRLPSWLHVADHALYDEWLGFRVGDDRPRTAPTEGV